MLIDKVMMLQQVDVYTLNPMPHVQCFLPGSLEYDSTKEPE